MASFRMSFPARVTLTTQDGGSWTARQDVPVGAPGLPGRKEAAQAKLRAEASLPGERLAEALALVERLEQVSVEELTSAFCSK